MKTRKRTCPDTARSAVENAAQCRVPRAISSLIHAAPGCSSLFIAIILLALIGIESEVAAHGVSTADARFLRHNEGFQFPVYLYLGAKHMVTGYDHLLYLFGVIFYLQGLRSVALYVSLFALGHSITLITGVLAGLEFNVHIIDAIIGLSVVYKAFENMGGFRALFGMQVDSRAAVFVFGLFHGFGLATKLQAMQLSPQGLVANLLSFNLGVELGQLVALVYLLLFLALVRPAVTGSRAGHGINFLLMVGGFSLTTWQLAYYVAG